MGATNGKFECMWLPAQSGKTRKVQEIIQAHRDMTVFGSDDYIQFLLCSNNRSLVNQTTKRMKDDLYDEADEKDIVSDAQIIGKVFNWQSGFKKHNLSVGEVALEIIDDKVEMVVCCAHSKRIEYLVKLINRLTESHNFTKKIMIWIDEADESIKLWSKHSAMLNNPKISRITLISATFDKVFKKYGRLRVMRQEKTHADCYHRFQESINIPEDIIGSENGAYGYLKSVVEKYEARLCLPGVRLFAPGDITQESHNKIAEFLSKKGFAVVVLNGERKEIIVPGLDKPFKLDSHLDDDEDETQEIGKQIAKLYHDNNLKRFPFAITGHKCIGRGLTFQSDKFLFDYGIIPYISDKANAYQTVARILGNIKAYDGYKVPTIFMTSKMIKVVTREENIAINIARMVYDNELEGDDGLVGSADIKQAGGVTVNVDPLQFDWPSKNGGTRPNYELYNTKEAIQIRMRELKPGSRPIDFKRDEQGFYICNAGATKRLTLSEISGLTTVTSNIPKSKVETFALNEISYRAYVYYEISETDPEKCLYALRWLRRIALPTTD